MTSVYVFSPYEQRIHPNDILTTNGLIFSLYTEKTKIQELLSDPFKSGSLGGPAVEKEFVRTTHLFTASMDLVNTLTYRHEKRFGFGHASVYAPIDNEDIIIDILESDRMPEYSYLKHSEAYEIAKLKFLQKYPQNKLIIETENAYDDYEGSLNRTMFVEEELYKQGIVINYNEWKKESYELDMIDIEKPKTSIKVGVGIILMREVLGYFLQMGKKRVTIEAALYDLIPYYKRFGFVLVDKNGKPTSNPKDAKIPNGYSMALFNLENGYELARQWAQTKIERNKDPYWENVFPSDISHMTTYSISKEHSICGFCENINATFTCGKCLKVPYCDQECARKHWLYEHSKKCK